jgi:hypothetical protein
MPRNGGLSRFTRLCVAFMVGLLLNATAGTAISKICADYRCCHYCAYYDQNGNFLYEIDWCWSDSGCSF